VNLFAVSQAYAFTADLARCGFFTDPVLTASGAEWMATLKRDFAEARYVDCTTRFVCQFIPSAKKQSDIVLIFPALYIDKDDGFQVQGLAFSAQRLS
jgi:hypothetical protein